MTNDKAKALTLEVAADELKRCEDMARMVLEREWAEHAGKGPISSKVEAAFTQLHNELAESQLTNKADKELIERLERQLAAFDQSGASL